MTVLMRFSVLAGITDNHAGSHLDVGEYFFQACKYHFQGHRPGQSKIKILRKTIIAEIASFQRGTTLEGENVPERRARKADQELGQAIVPFEHGFRDTATARLGKTV
jgi:hypothetical protein